MFGCHMLQHLCCSLLPPSWKIPWWCNCVTIIPGAINLSPLEHSYWGFNCSFKSFPITPTQNMDVAKWWMQMLADYTTLVELNRLCTRLANPNPWHFRVSQAKHTMFSPTTLVHVDNHVVQVNVAERNRSSYSCNRVTSPIPIKLQSSADSTNLNYSYGQCEPNMVPTSQFDLRKRSNVSNRIFSDLVKA